MYALCRMRPPRGGLQSSYVTTNCPIVRLVVFNFRLVATHYGSCSPPSGRTRGKLDKGITVRNQPIGLL
jgi:hypothetical protein